MDNEQGKKNEVDDKNIEVAKMTLSDFLTHTETPEISEQDPELLKPIEKDPSFKDYDPRAEWDRKYPQGKQDLTDKPLTFPFSVGGELETTGLSEHSVVEKIEKSEDSVIEKIEPVADDGFIKEPMTVRKVMEQTPDKYLPDAPRLPLREVSTILPTKEEKVVKANLQDESVVFNRNGLAAGEHEIPTEEPEVEDIPVIQKDGSVKVVKTVNGLAVADETL